MNQDERKSKVEVAPKIEYTPIQTSYMGIDGLKAPGTKIEYTPEMLKEWIKCYNDPLYFMSNYYYIVELDKGLIQIKLWDFQEDLITHLHENRFSIVLASRQVGKTVITVGYILWYLIFHDYKYIAVLSKNSTAASETMSRLKTSFMQIPQWLQPNVTKWAETSIAFDNGSYVSSQATTENAGRSASANILFLDEFAFVPTNIAQKFYTSAYPIISNSKESKVIICSTPNGHNHFYVMQDRALKGENDYKHFKVTWDQVPGRDEEWKNSTIRNLSMENGVDGKSKFAQEYDLEFENASTKVLIGAAIQRRIVNNIMQYSPLEIEKLKDINGLKIYEKPQMYKENESYIYFITADVGNGVGNDDSAFSVIKASKEKYIQVASYNNNMINPIAFAELIHAISEYYFNAYILIENNGPGQSTVDHLWYNIESEYMIHTDKKMVGIKTVKRNRDKGISNLKEYLEYDTLELRDLMTLQEISNFEQNKNGKFEAREGFNDDLVMALVIFSYFTKDESFSSFINNDEIIDGIKDRMKEMIEEENPYIFNYDEFLDEETINLVSSEDYIDQMVPNFQK